MDSLDVHTGGVQPSSRLAAREQVLIPLCRKGDRVGLERLLESGASLAETDVEGNTPLHVAVEATKNEIATVQCLLASGANPNATNYIGAVPLHYVCLRKSNHRGIANLLLENGALIDAQTLAGRSPLHFASETGLPELVEVLCIFGADAGLQDTEGNSPMHLALAKENGRDTVRKEVIEHLLTYQPRHDIPNKEGLTPLHLACRSGYFRCLQLLFERQADLLAVTAAQQTALHLAVQGGHGEVTHWLLQIAPGCIDFQDAAGDAALHLCAQAGNYDCAVLLLKAGANPNLKNLRKMTPLQISKQRGTGLDSVHNPELAQLLKDMTKSESCHQS